MQAGRGVFAGNRSVSGHDEDVVARKESKAHPEHPVPKSRARCLAPEEDVFIHILMCRVRTAACKSDLKGSVVLSI